MPLDQSTNEAVIQAYREYIASGAWGCVALMQTVNLVQQARPDLSQSAAITAAMDAIKRACG